MGKVPYVETLSDYLEIAEKAIAVYLPLADEIESALIYFDQQWFILINQDFAQIQSNKIPKIETPD